MRSGFSAWRGRAPGRPAVRRRNTLRPITAPRAPLAVVAVAALAVTGVAAAPAGASVAHPAARQPAKPDARLSVVYRNLALLNGATATVYSNGLAEVWNRTRSQTEYRTVPPTGAGETGTATALPSRAQLRFDLIKAPARAYVPGELELVLARGVSATAAARTVSTAGLRSHATPDWTTDAAFNRTLARLGADRMTAVFPARAVRALTPQPGGLDLAQAYVLHVTAATMPGAVAALAGSPAVAYAAPDWTVSTTDTAPIPVPEKSVRAADTLARQLARRPARRASAALPPLPSNYALATSEQSLLNRPGVDWTPAYEALESKYHQLPGTGETITDVSLGDLDSAGISTRDACHGYVAAFGPTTIVRGGQRYLDWPSMPLIPTWVSSGAGALDPKGEVCGEDPFDQEIGLDFAMMAPLPHAQQRAGETGSGLTDLLGIAPGAHYRLVVTSDTSGATTSIDQSFLAAAQQTPRPNVITASLAFGLDAEGFPSRYLEDDPLTEALISSIVRQYHITVSVSANDGLRTSTNAAVSPSGGSAATNVTAAGGTPTSINSVQLSSTPSRDYDSGSIDVGGTTLDDIFAAPPQDPANAAAASQHAFPENRWTGYASFSSGYGSRVDISAPADNLTAFEHTQGGAADAVTVDNIGGTSGSSQEVGAAAAVVQQTARLTGDTGIASHPSALRTELEQTATPVPDATQADTTLNVGPQLDLGQAVTSLIGQAGGTLVPGVARVAVEQRQPDAGYLDAVFATATDPGAISLAGAGQDAYLTIAPDWVGLPAGVTYKLAAIRSDGSSHRLGSGPWTRLLPSAIFTAAGVSPPTSGSQSVSLVYTASAGGKVVAKATVPLSFTAGSGAPEVLAPQVPAVVTGATIPVAYNLGSNSGFPDPQLVVSEPGRMTPFDHFYRNQYTVSLTRTKGTVNVPVADLQGGGIYGVAIQAAPAAFEFSDFAFTRVQGAPADVRPAAPLLSAAGYGSGYTQSMPYGGKFSVSWNVANVPRATGAYLEVSAPGPNDFNSYAMYNNPNGTIRDHNGADSGSTYFQPLHGTAGKVTVTAAAAGLVPTLVSQVRVLPVTAAGTAAGESSDVSTISENGVAPTDGGATVDGFGVDASQPDGFVTSNQTLPGNEYESSVQTFSQQTQAITRTVLPDSTSDSYTTADQGGPGVFAGGAGLVEDTTGDGTVSYHVLNPLTKVARAWKPPVSTGFVQPADDQATADAAFGGWTYGTHGDGDAQVFSSDVAAGTHGTVYPAEAPLKKLGLPVVTGFAQDTSTDTAVLQVADFFDTNVAPAFVSVNLATGARRSFAGVGSGIPTGLAIDSGTGLAASPESGGVGIVNLASGGGTFASPGGFVYQHPAVDPASQQFVVQELSPPNSLLTTPGLGSTPDNNALCSEVVLSEQGQVTSRIEQFSFYNVFTSTAGQLTQLGATPGEAYTTGTAGEQVQPFGF